MKMVSIEFIEGAPYKSGRDKHIRKDYIRIMWSRGCIEMKKTYWDKLPKYKKDKIFSMAIEKSPSI